MTINGRNEILEILRMPEDGFRETVLPEAEKTAERTLHRTLRVTAMMGYTNICKNNCLYCGMRAGNPSIPRYRTPPEQVTDRFLEAAGQGYGRAFLIAGEDPLYGFDNLLSIVRALKERGMYVSLACGEYEKSRYEELADAGTDEYVLKFEMSDPENFNRLNPSTTFGKRMKAIETIRSLGMKLASGNIVDRADDGGTGGGYPADERTRDQLGPDHSLPARGGHAACAGRRQGTAVRPV